MQRAKRTGRRVKGSDAFDVLRERARRSLTPLSVHIDLTHRCNLNCVHCYIGPRDFDEIRLPRLREILDELARMGTLFVTFSGGEIFLRSDLFALLDYARLKRFSVKLITNATLIDRTVVDRLRDYPIYQAGVSVYSLDPVIHDAMTAAPGSLAKTKAAVEMLAHAGMAVALKTLITRLNAPSYPALAAWADSMGPRVNRQYDLLVTPRNDGVFGPAGLNLDVKSKVAFLKANRKEGQDQRKVEELETKAPKRDRGATPCFAGWTGSYIGPSGVVYPCVDWHVACGDVRTQSFSEIWRDSPGLASARGLTIAKMAACTKCALVDTCALCPGINRQETGDAAKPSKLVCGRTRAFAEAMGRAPGGKPKRRKAAR
ncbi:MAG: radical SAM protein [Deltaproteobacteria bacterium]|nr:radical SAM protein [Deltaproteobacteria bacterium]